MARKKKESPKPYWLVLSEDVMEIHLTGEILSNAVFQKVVEIMKDNRESDQPKTVRFVVPGSSMMMSVRYAIPSVYYESIVLEGQANGEEVLKHAVGM